MSAVMSWMKEFLILYLILTILMQLAAAEEYKKYLRFLSGIILLLVLASPILRLSGSGSMRKVLDSYEQFWENMDDFSPDAKQAGMLQKEQNIREYEKALAADITAQAQAQGIAVSRISVDLTEDYEINSVAVWLDARRKNEDPSAKDRMASLLKDVCCLEDRQIFID